MNHSASHKIEKLCLNLAAKFENISFTKNPFISILSLEA